MAVSNFATKDLVSGGIFVLAGGYFAIESLNYEVGTAFRMGPGFMPLFLGAVLAALGIAVAAAGWNKPDEEALLAPSWRGIALIIGVVIFFGATIRGLGFVPVVLISSFAAAMSSRLNSPVFSILLAITLTVMCTLIFVIGLGMSVPLFGLWLGPLGA
ncbi:MAG: tripartite tricarboxylate transporter TctB family protein [Candidatus Devosia phytovorans]|uniref:Tripartite tricarboxylate transporter TctB family protein n=1 Tax=Candidatus Devosia phytovorans TaxID=3121372 RepID=A0AAJ5VU08_9HYPH|nr:tripartite tricarboxylate transporter TctB family protein [Devosia sp.]WEK04796.1 MAG: tripartite tricarboxylate transporter TctB family protein [Devosia sp.]